MTMYMFKIISVTNRSLCPEPLLPRLQKIAKAGADSIILREKDLSPADYLLLAQDALAACSKTATQCILHGFPQVAQHLDCHAIHLPLSELRLVPRSAVAQFRTRGCSCHSLADVLEAQQLGCTYVTLGHIFPTECKKGLSPRGLSLLESVCREASVPVYAIGGIDCHNIASVRDAGASGACIMSGLMGCKNPATELEALRQALEG